jgi:hypothetical protein
VEGLNAALERARRAYSDEREMMWTRPDVARDRNRLRKVSPARMVSGHATAMLAELDWWGIPRPKDLAEAKRARLDVLGRLEQQPGSPGDSALRAAGFELLRWWAEHGNNVTATIETDTARDSYTVEFLSAHLPTIDERLDENAARAAAYTIAQAWRAQEPPPEWLPNTHAV